MSSVDFGMPPSKLTFSAIGIVIVLHALTAIGLAIVETPVPFIPKPKVLPLLEIELIASSPIEIEEPKIIEKIEIEPEPNRKVEPLSQVQNKPKPAATPKPTKPNQKTSVKKESVVEKPKPVVKPIARDNTVNEQVITRSNQPQTRDIDKEQQQIETQRQKQILAAQAAAREQAQALARQQALAAQQAQAMAQQKVESERLAAAARAKAAQDAAAQQAKDAAAQTQADKVAEAAAQAASNKPVNFTANSASWASTPNFNFPSRAERGASSGDTFTVVLLMLVNKQGSIENVSISRSSGNREIDRAAKQQVKQGRFKPFMEGGIARVGNVTLPVSYKVP